MNQLPILGSDPLAAPYVAYSYSYPHKSAYGPLDPPVSLDEVWQRENRQSLFLYTHLPFCEMRCGFCNLFAKAGSDSAAIDTYLDSIERQTRRLSEATSGKRTVTRFALGGGTPTVLSVAQLERLFDLVSQSFDFNPANVPTSIETSPKTATEEHLKLLHERGIQRVSIGVQSFLEEEAHGIGRPQKAIEVREALARIKTFGFPILNIDLIYGQPNQTLETWNHSLEAALQYEPEEIFLYPLYVRPQTGLGRRARTLESSALQPIDLYRAGRDKLKAAGYRQLSMRCFTRDLSQVDTGPAYCCQSDGMLGLGAGARSYTSRLHYSSRFAVNSSGVQSILEEWTQRSEETFGYADWGIVLNDEERRRRFIIQSLLHYTGLSRTSFARTFESQPEETIPELTGMTETGLIEESDNVLRLTEKGVSLSDAIGPALYSESSRARLREFSAP
ncbi:STM4012 family radical SAM protein [Bremerella cremea]|uniref:STM4012 family radical SAM protein n=1 Tax=Bremerella cremea TaxID=1031537 RepID=UPI0031E974E3